VKVLTAGTPPRGITGKLNAMLVAVAEARGTLLAFNDSDTRPEPGALSTLVTALLQDERHGAAFTTIFAASDAATAADVAYELLVNAWYGPSVSCAQAPDGTLPFIMGQLMVFRRQALESIGGLGTAAGQFVDDMYLGRRLVEEGWRNAVVHAPLRVVTGGLDLRSFMATFRRWVLFSQSGLSLRWTWPNWARGIACWVAWLCLGAALATGAWGTLLASALAIGISVWDQLTLQRHCHGGPLALRHLWVPAVLPLLAGGVALTSRSSHNVDWRGRNYRLNAGAKLDAQPES
jgi:ceramide glucosyltransferase